MYQREGVKSKHPNNTSSEAVVPAIVAVVSVSSDFVCVWLVAQILHTETI